MAKKKNQTNNNNENNNNNNEGGGGKKENAMTTVVLKADLHCEGCARKVVKSIRSFDGVESVKVGDIELNKLTIIGKLDPMKLRDKVAEKTKKKVELISPAPPKKEKNDEQKNSGAGAEQKDEKSPAKKDDKSAAKKDEKKPKEVPVTTAVLKVQWHCEGCIQKIQKIVSKTKGYMDMSIDKQKDLVTLKGAMDMKAVAETLKEKLKRQVEIVPAKKEGGGEKGNNNSDGGGDKKGKGGSSGSGGGEKKGKGGGEENGGGDGGHKAEGYKMEYGGGQLVEYPYPQVAHESGYMGNYVYAPQLFSDENPNACAIM